MDKVKIEVIKKLNNKDMFGDNPPVNFTGGPECDHFKVGQEFLYDGNFPTGFCPWAFADIQRDIIHLRFNGDFPHIQEKGVILSSCTDGLRPVIFKLSRIKET